MTNGILRGGLWRASLFSMLWTGAVGCGDTESRSVDETAKADVLTESASALSRLEQLKARFRVRLSPASEPEGSSREGWHESALPSAGAAPRFRIENDALHADWESASRTRVRLPLRGAGAFRVEASASGVAVETRLRGARDVHAELAEGYVLYPGAAPGGGSVLQRVTVDGTEDFVTLERPPEEARVVYAVQLSRAVAGLRLVANTLELLDGHGNPELRVAPPYLVGADGRRVDAALDVEGCDVDRDPAAPWGRPTVDPGAVECEVHVTWDDAQVAYPAVLDPSWSSTASMAQSRMNHAVARLTNGRILVSGGWSGTAQRATAEIYNPTSRTWASTGSMGTARMAHTATDFLGGTNGRVLVAGGGRLTSPLNSAEVYNADTGAWSSAGTFTDARYGHTATEVSGNGVVLIAGGSNGTNALGTSRLYDAATNTWSSTTTNMNVAQEGHSAHRVAVSSQIRVAVIGQNFPNVQLYNPSTKSWSGLSAVPAQMAVPRKNHAATVTGGGRVLVAGGVNSSGQAMATAEEFDPNTSTWSRLGAMRFARTFHSLSQGFTTDMIVAGNNASFGGGTSEIFEGGLWLPGPNLVTARYAHTAIRMANGKVLLAGGATPGTSTPIANAEEYDPTPTSWDRVEYKLPATTDPTVLSDRQTELWASFHRPATLASGVKYPLIVLLHGNHRTCGTGSNPRNDHRIDYTMTGQCPPTHVVVPNHAGYNYIADALARRGYIVISINSNRGINFGPAPSKEDCPPDNEFCDPDLITARGRLVLRHLQELSKWNRGAAAPPPGIPSLVGKIDFAQVGMMGHSRGGGGVRDAYELYRQAGSHWPATIVDAVTFRGIFEIGPYDFGSLFVTPSNVKWATLLPMCDGDVGNLRGIRTFDRSVLLLSESNVTFKASYTVWGANHNYYNTQWQRSDAAGCIGHRALFSTSAIGSAEQQQTGLTAMLSFFRANVGPNLDTSLNQIFDTNFAPVPEPRVDRGFHPGSSSAASRRLEDFNNATGTSTFGQANVHNNVTVVHASIPEHDSSLRGGTISWTSASTNNYFQSNFTQPNSGIILTPYQFLDLRVDRANDPALNTTPTTNFTVRLVNANGTLSTAIQIDPLAVLTGPVGGENVHSMLQTVRIPLSAFTGATLGSIRAVRLTFSSTPSGKIYVANIRATTGTAVSSGSSAAFASLSAAPSGGAQTAAIGTAPAARDVAEPFVAPAPAVQRITAGNTIARIRTRDASRVEIAVAVSSAFLGGDERLVLRIGNEEANFASFVGGDLRGAVFTLSRAAFDRLRGGEPVRAGFGVDRPWRLEWSFGGFDKSRLDR